MANFDVELFVKESNLIEGYEGEPYFTNHMEAFEYLTKNGISEKSIKFAHGELLKGLMPKEQIGTYRTVMVTVGGQYCPKPHLIQRLMEILFEQPKTTSREIFEFHYFFECIHPFIDGNGRIGRCVLNVMLDKSDKSVIYNNRKFDYYNNIRNFREEEMVRRLYDPSFEYGLKV